jgi:hypothetical protein
MPLPLVHFAIAHQLAQSDPLALTPEFLLGSIAPDAIHLRAGSTRVDKNRTHLLRASHAETADEEYLAVLRHFWLAGVQQPPPQANLLKGYVAHLLADRRWFQSVFAHFRRVIPAEATGEAGARLYYQEADQVDLALYRQMPWRAEVWQRLAAAQPLPVADLLTAAEVDGWRTRTFAWFEQHQADPVIECRFIPYPLVLDFVADSAEWIAKQFSGWSAAQTEKGCGVSGKWSYLCGSTQGHGKTGIAQKSIVAQKMPATYQRPSMRTRIAVLSRMPSS